MRNMIIAFFRGLIAVTFLSLMPNLQQAAAQQNGGPRSGQDPTFYTGNYTTKYARYYAPYALQAAGAYLSVSSLDETINLPRGEDVRRLVEYAIDEPGLVEKASKYLRAWRYQFGSDKYLDCFEADPDCVKA